MNNSHNSTPQGLIVAEDFPLLAEELRSREVDVIYHIPPSSRDKSRDLPLDTLKSIIEFLEDVEMEPEFVFPTSKDGKLVMTVHDLFTHMEVT